MRSGNLAEKPVSKEEKPENSQDPLLQQYK